MAPKRRHKRNDDLVDYMEVATKRNAEGKAIPYYSYIMPDGTRVSLNTTPQDVRANRINAIAAARALNARLKRTNASVDKLVTTALGLRSLASVIQAYRDTALPIKDLAARTLQETEFRLKRMEADIGHMPIEQIDTLACRDWLNNFTGNGQTKARGLMIDLFDFAKSEGVFTGENPAAITRKMPEPKKARLRLEMDGFNAIRSAAASAEDHWLVNAMDAALLTLQRRGDIVEMRFDEIESGALRVIQNKTSKFTEKAFIEVELGAQMLAVVARCRASGIASPFLIHRRADKMKTTDRAKRAHWSAITPEYLTKAFARYRDELPMFSSMPVEQRPGFHEIRSLGGRRYIELGYSVDFVNALMGHTSEEMTQHYLKGDHDKIRWTRAQSL